MDSGDLSSVMSPQCRRTSYRGSVVGSSASWVSDKTRKRTDFEYRDRFEAEVGVGEGERVRLRIDMLKFDDESWLRGNSTWM
jgi:hypothetical protein